MSEFKLRSVSLLKPFLSTSRNEVSTAVHRALCTPQQCLLGVRVGLKRVVSNLKYFSKRILMHPTMELVQDTSLFWMTVKTKYNTLLSMVWYIYIFNTGEDNAGGLS